MQADETNGTGVQTGTRGVCSWMRRRSEYEESSGSRRVGRALGCLGVLLLRRRR